MVTGFRAPVLLVEDDAGIREALGDLLELLGVRVVVAGDGEEAWALLYDAGLYPALVLLDLFLPRLDGIALLGRIRADARLQSIRVVTMSAAVKERPPLADAHLEKPFDIERLLAVVRQHCRPDLARSWGRTPAGPSPAAGPRLTLDPRG
jgi:DNA-binding response OmpR family regulator